MRSIARRTIICIGMMMPSLEAFCPSSSCRGFGGGGTTQSVAQKKFLRPLFNSRNGQLTMAAEDGDNKPVNIRQVSQFVAFQLLEKVIMRGADPTADSGKGEAKEVASKAKEESQVDMDELGMDEDSETTIITSSKDEQVQVQQPIASEPKEKIGADVIEESTSETAEDQIATLAAKSDISENAEEEKADDEQINVSQEDIQALLRQTAASPSTASTIISKLEANAQNASRVFSSSAKDIKDSTTTTITTTTNEMTTNLPIVDDSNDERIQNMYANAAAQPKNATTEQKIEPLPAAQEQSSQESTADEQKSAKSSTADDVASPEILNEEAADTTVAATTSDDELLLDSATMAAESKQALQFPSVISLEFGRPLEIIESNIPAMQNPPAFMMEASNSTDKSVSV